MTIIRCSLALVIAVVAVQGAGAQNQTFQVQLTSPLSSRGNQRGDKVSAVVVSPPWYRGDLMEGTVKQAKSGGSVKKSSTLAFTFTSWFHQGRMIPVSSEVTSFANSKGQANVDEEGRIVKKSNNVGKVLLATLAGAAIGAAAGGARGAAIGAGAGAVASIVLVSMAVKGPDIRFDAGTQFTLNVRPH